MPCGCELVALIHFTHSSAVAGTSQATEPYRASSCVEALSRRLSALFLPFLFQYHCYFKRASVRRSFSMAPSKAEFAALS